MEAMWGATRKSRARRLWVFGSAAAVAVAAGLAFALVLADTEQYAGESAAPAQSGGTPTVFPTVTGAPMPPTSRPPSAGVGGGGGGELGGFEIDRVIEALPAANAAFNAPSTLRLEEPAVIQLLLSGRRSISRLQEQITALGRREGARIKASDAMEANLAGTGFKIEAITPADPAGQRSRRHRVEVGGRADEGRDAAPAPDPLRDPRSRGEGVPLHGAGRSNGRSKFACRSASA